MKKNIYTFLGIIVVITVLGVVFYGNSQKTIDQQNTNKMVETRDETKPQNQLENKLENNVENAVVEKVKYLEYSNNFLSENEDRKVVLFFFANWCPTCKKADAEFQKNLSKLPSDLTIIKVNYNDDQTDDNEKKLAEKYGITYQHTFVYVDKDGQEIAKWNGGDVEMLNEKIGK